MDEGLIAEAKARYAAEYGVHKSDAKLDFGERCEAFGCLLMGIRPAMIQEMYGLSRASVSYLAGRAPDKAPAIVEIPYRNSRGDFIHEEIGGRDMGRKRNPDRKLRYQDVVDEYQRLGENEFLTIYFFTPAREARERDAKRRIYVRKYQKEEISEKT